MSDISFYQDASGDKLIDDSRYPQVIKNYLRGERLLLEKVTVSSDLLIEVGCMQGRHAAWALERGYLYLGIDVVPRYIADATTRLTQDGRIHKCRVEVARAEDLPAVLRGHQSFLTGRHPFILFPFNSIGNMEDIERVAKAVSETELPFMISTYGTGRYATACRERYYRNCEYSGLSIFRSDTGVCFKSTEGLATYAYDSQYLRSLFPSGSVIRQPFSSIGVAYLHHNAQRFLAQ